MCGRLVNLIPMDDIYIDTQYITEGKKIKRKGRKRKRNERIYERKRTGPNRFGCRRVGLLIRCGGSPHGC